jgi:SAM-dependent methyltransferase
VTKPLSDDTTAAARWNSLFSTPGFPPIYPSEAVIRWCFRTFPRARAAQVRLLDLGCGTGRHALFFAREGYDTAAVDYSDVAVEALATACRREGLAVDGRVAPADELPFPANSFDGILAFGVLYYLPPAAMRRAIAELHRVLKPGGKAFVMIKSARDSRAVFARKAGGHRYEIVPLQGKIAWPAEVGMTLTLLNRRTVRSYFACFEEIQIDRSTVTHGGGRFVDDEWLIHVGKESQ